MYPNHLRTFTLDLSAVPGTIKYVTRFTSWFSISVGDVVVDKN